ncbi:MAG TPA: Nramp family divalent metal transporter [Candidatus Limnocylindrales bacterium]|nr:Nramp family divalent metal transporter [Candidatus Limnocylindrales bacterium]
MANVVRLLRPDARLPRRQARRLRVTMLALLAVAGPGMVSGFADNDAGGITTYSIAGAQFGYALLWVLLASQLALMVTQEAGARLGLATGHGLSGLIRERFGVRWALLAVLTMLIANLGDTVAEFAGIGAALSLFGVPVWLSAALAAGAIVALLSRGNYRRIQLLFLLIGIGVSVAYGVSAILARPDWLEAGRSVVVPHLQNGGGAYLLAVVGVVGTTITPWGQSFIQSYVVDKGLGPENLLGSRIDVTIGALLTNVVAGFIVVACAATLWTHGAVIIDAADAARALGPLAGESAFVLFAIGLLAASFLGLGTVPLASAYTATEAFGWEAGLDHRPSDARAFYGLLAFFVAFAALFVLVPNLPLVPVMFLSQVLDGIMLAPVLVFVMLLARDERLMGSLRSGPVATTLGWAVTIAIGVMSLVLVVTALTGGA